MRFFLFIFVASFYGCATYHPEAVSDQKDVHILSNADMSSPLNYGQSKQAIKNSIVSIEKKIQLNKRSTSKMLDLADLYLMSNQIDKAEFWVRKALRFDMKNKRAKLVLAGVFYRRDLLDMSSMMLEVLGGQESTDASVLNLLALIEIRRMNQDRGMQLFSKALDVDPDNTAVRMNMGIQYFRYRRLSEASIQFERILGVVPDHRDAHMHIAMIDAAKGQYDSALDKLNHVLDEDAGNAVALYNRASVLKDMKEYDDAMDDLRLLLTNEVQTSDRTKAAFVMVKRLNTLIQDREERMSYSEINRLASSLKSGSDREGRTAKRKQNVRPQQKKSPKSAQVQQPRKSAQEEEVDELEELEKELLGEGL